MHIAYYITGHGYGHGVRAAAICNQFGPSVRLTIRTSIPERFFREEIRRDFTYIYGQFDCGCVQRDGVTVDIAATARRYMELADANAGRLLREAVWAVNNRIDVIVSDITPFAFEVAAAAGIPSVAVSNFSWFDIYEPYVSMVPSFKPYVEHIGRQYGMASLLLALSPANPMRCFGRRRLMPIVGRRGIDRGDEIRARFGIGGDSRLGLIYAGEYGLAEARWERLAGFHGWEFLGLYDMPGAAPNYHVMRKGEFRYEDICASVDCVIAKLGYGVYAECRINGAPLIFLPRGDFAEYPVLERAVLSWGHGYRLEAGEFVRLAWDDALARICRRRRPRRCLDRGAKQCAERITQWARRGDQRRLRSIF